MATTAQPFYQTNPTYNPLQRTHHTMSSSSTNTFLCGHTTDQVRYQRQLYAQQLATIPETKIIASSTQMCEMCVQAQQYALYVQQQRAAGRHISEDEEDEGFDEPESTPEQDAAFYAQSIAYRRSTDYSASAVRVHKAVRGRRRRPE